MALTVLEIRLEAETTRLQKDLDKANRRIKRWSRRATKASVAVSKAFKRVGFAAGGAAVGVGLLVKNSLAAGDALAKTADKLGITTEALAGLQHAAELTGVAQETLSKALTKQQKAIFDADRGLVTYSQHFEKLGLSTAMLKAQQPDEQFRTIAEALNKLENQTDKTAIAYDIFGGRGTALINTLALGRDGLAAVAEEAQVLGIALTRIDAAKMEEANDTFTRMKAVVKGLGNSITIAVAPVLDALGKKFVEAAKESGGMVNFVNKGMNTIVGAVGFVLDAFNGLKVVWKGLEVAFAFTVAAIVSMIRVINEPFTQLLGALAPFSDKAKSAFESLQNFGSGAFVDLAEKQREFNEALMAPIPSDSLKKWVEEVQFAAQQVAEAKAASVPSVQEDPGLTLLVDTNKERTAAKKKQLATEAKMESAASKAKLNVTKGALGNLSSLMNSSSRKEFAIGKKAALASALIKGYEAVQSSYAAGAKIGGPLLGAAFAATAVIATKANIDAIKSQSFSGGGGSISSSATSGSVSDLTNIPSQQEIQPEQQTGQATFIIVGGGGSSETELDQLMDRVSERLNEGSQVIIRRDSVQAQEILAATGA